MKLTGQIGVGLAAGVVVGVVAKVPAAAALAHATIALEPIGTAFIKLISMTVVPLVIGSLFTGVASLGDARRLERIGGRTLAYFALTTALAAIIGLLVTRMVGFRAGPQALASGPVAAHGAPTVTGFLLGLIPENPFAAVVQGDLLPLIVAVCLFAAAATRLAERERQQVVTAFARLNDLSMILIGWVMQLAPVAVFFLVAATVARFGAALLGDLALFGATVLAALAADVALVLLPAARVAAGQAIGPFVREVSDALLLALATASSSAALPVSIAAAQRVGVPAEVAGFVLPAGATINKNGAAAYKAVTAVFLLTLYGMPVGASQELAIVAAATVAAFAGAGVPGSSLVTTLIVLDAVGLGAHAAAGIALVAAIDRPLDMCRTLVNTLGNLVGAAWVGRAAEAVEPVAVTP